MRSRKKRLWTWVMQSMVFTTLLSAALALPSVIKIGGLFETTEEQQELAFGYAIDMVNSDIGILPKSTLSAQVRKVAPQDSFRALKSACDFFKEGIAALFGPPSPSIAGTLQSACDNLQVPYLQTHWDYKSSPRTHSISLFPESTTLAKAFLELITEFHWKSFTLIYEDNEALMRLQKLVKIPTSHDIKVTLRHVDAEPDYTKMMKDLKKMREHYFVVDLPLHKVPRLFQDAAKVELMTSYESYILTSMDIHSMDWVPLPSQRSNVTAFRIVDPELPQVRRVVKDWIFSEKRQGRQVTSKQPVLTETALLYDGIVILSRALQELDSSQTIDIRSLYCQDTFQWNHGSSVINYMKMVQRQGLSGEIKFDKNGERTFFTLDHVKLNSKGVPIKLGTWDPIHGLQASIKDSDQELFDIKEIMKNTTFRVTSILTPPYMMKKVVQPGEKLEGNDKYRGFCKDIMDELAEKFHFKYEFVGVEKGGYGDNKTGEWDGMIGRLLRREADLAIADLTITHKRESVVDFTYPFMTIGVSILFKKPGKKEAPLFSFLQPLSLEVWFCMATAFLGVSLLLFITARLSPYEWVNPHPCEAENDVVENQFTLKNSFCFVIGSVMQQGSDILPRAVSTRIIASSWWFFTLIMISSYTANLAAFLTSQRMKSPIESASDLAKQTTIEYGCVKDGSTMGFFQNSTYPIYKRMWSFMESTRPSVFTKNNDEGIDRVKMGNYAFLMESTTIEYQVARHCDLVKVGGELDTKGYGIATPPGSPFRTILNSGVIQMQEDSRFHILKDKWWKREGPSCPVEKSGDESLKMGFADVAGVFLVVACGTTVGVIIVIFEFVWKAKKMVDRDPIPVMLWRELKHIVTCRGSSRPIPKSSAEPSPEKVPMMNLRTNPTSLTDDEPYT